MGGVLGKRPRVADDAPTGGFDAVLPSAGPEPVDAIKRTGSSGNGSGVCARVSDSESGNDRSSGTGTPSGEVYGSDESGVRATESLDVGAADLESGNDGNIRTPSDPVYDTDVSGIRAPETLHVGAADSSATDPAHSSKNSGASAQYFVLGSDKTGRSTESSLLGSDGSGIAVSEKTWKGKAEEEVTSILNKVAVLRDEVVNARAQSQFCGQKVVGKRANLEAALYDRKLLRTKNENIFASLSSEERQMAIRVISSLDKNPINCSTSMSNKREQSQKCNGNGVVPVVCGERFGVPLCSMTCNVQIDELNWILSEAYTSISYLMVRVQICMAVSQAVSEERTRMVADLKGAIGVHRTMCRKIRTIIQELGFPPLIEPTPIWKEKFPLL